MQPRKNLWNPLPLPSSSLLLWHWLAERHHLGWQRFQPDFCMVSQASMALCLSIRLTTG